MPFCSPAHKQDSRVRKGRAHVTTNLQGGLVFVLDAAAFHMREYFDLLG